MAGDWIAIRVDLHSVPEVIRLARLCSRPIDEIVGMLVRFWGWAQTHTDNGVIANLDISDAAGGAHVPEEFVAALANVGWLIENENGFTIPNFGRWMASNTKRRLLERERQRRCRGKLCHADVTLERDKSVTTEEKRREYIPPSNDGGIKATSSPSSPAKPATPCRVDVGDAEATIAQAWNSLPEPLPRLMRWTAKRRQALRCRLAEPRWLEQCIAAIARIPSCPFLCGKNSRAWTANIDWLLRPDSVAKILEGQYTPPDVTEHAHGQHARSTRYAAGPGQRHPDDADPALRGW